jgi:hypothetical protein
MDALWPSTQRLKAQGFKVDGNGYFVDYQDSLWTKVVEAFRRPSSPSIFLFDVGGVCDREAHPQCDCTAYGGA